MKGDVVLFDLKKVRNVHFIGIGGISMSGLAEILYNEGICVTGSDMKASITTKNLNDIGIKVFIPHDEENINGSDLVIYTAAVAMDNPELLKAKRLGIKTIDRATLLGHIMDDYNFSIACAGTHGKTSTTSMVSSILLDDKKDPTVHIGGLLPSIQKSTKVGSKGCFITEACEYVDSFLKLNPKMAILSNVELDHLDYFKDLAQLKKSFEQFVAKVPSDGYVVANIDDENIGSIIQGVKCNLVTYGIENKNAMWQARDISFDKRGFPSFNVYESEKFIGKISLSVPGNHNVSNALSAISGCLMHFKGLDFETVKKSLVNFKGAGRRFEIKGEVGGVIIVDDYAHHPTEIKVTLNSVKNGTYKNVICVFQPHTYTRTKELLFEFSNSFENADVVIISDIYAAREKDTGEIHAKDLCELLIAKGKKAVYFENFENIQKFILENSAKGDIVITMGAGDIFKVGEGLLNK